MTTLCITSIAERAHAALPIAWTAVDVGAPALRGSAQEASCTTTTGCPAFTIAGAGVGIGGTADQFMFVYQRLTGDGVIKLRMLSLAGASTMEAGLMVRESLAASARQVSLVAGSSGAAIRSRTSAGGATASRAVARGGWLRLERVGPSVTASISSDGSQWTVVASQTVALPSTVYVGIVVTSRSTASLATGMVSSMSVTPTTPTMPSGWTSADVGAAPSPGTASYSTGGFIGASYGAGFSGAADAFRFMYTRVRNDAKLSTRVVASQGSAGRQAGIVLRTTLEASAAEVALVADDLGVVLVRRGGAGQTATKTRVASTLASVHLRLDRVGSMIAVAYSLDGTAWTTVTSVGTSLGSEMYAGLAVAAGPNGGVAAAAFDRLSLVSVAANAPPVVSLVSPVNGQIVLQGKTMALSATASDPDDLVARVDFRVNGVTIASDTTAPYSASWTAGSAGLYTLVAAAADYDGALTTSAPVALTVAPDILNPLPSGPWRLMFDASLDHAIVDYYVLDVYNSVTQLRVLSKNLGKPALAADGSCTVDINALVLALPLGLYHGVVRAVDSATGTGSSLPYSFQR